MNEWYKKIGVLWTIIGALFTGFASMIALNLSYQPEINRLRLENMTQDSVITKLNGELDSYTYMNKHWKWNIEDALKHADLIYFESGIMKIKGE